MQNFVVSARKYRPAAWDDVVGQDHVVNTLKNAIKTNHLAQSFLFCGPRGVGKTTCARILSKTINCENLQGDGDACNMCESCRSFNENASFNIHEIDAASNNSVDDIRNLVEQVRYAPQSGKYKIYIIDEVHMLSSSAFNAFLKTLEEPPSYVKFILATTEKHKIIPTILSRCQLFDFNRILVKDMMTQIKKICKSEHIECEEEAIHLIAQKADGAMRDALSIFDRITSFSGEKITAKDVIENLNILDYDYYFKITDALMSEDASTCLLLLNEINNKGFDGDTFIIGLAEHFRSLLVSKDKQTLKLLEASDVVTARYKNQSQLTEASFLITALNILNQADVQYRASKNKRLHVEIALLKLCYIHNAVSTLELNDSKEKKSPELKNNNTIEKKANENVAYYRTSQSIKNKLIQNAGEKETVLIPTRQTLKDSFEKKENQPANNPGFVNINQPAEEFIALLPELFFLAWKQISDTIRSEKNHIAVIMDHAEISIEQNNTVHVKLGSAMETGLIKEFTGELKSFLFEALNNKTFELIFSVTERNKENKRPYTAMEKYKKMEAINPFIKQLKDTLGFELDY